MDPLSFQEDMQNALYVAGEYAKNSYTLKMLHEALAYYSIVHIMNLNLRTAVTRLKYLYSRDNSGLH